ncbi:hypothetical protein E2562_000290 [Oryza meyeriana var. granulata]|uniref:Uncharacterized protein n=1 Tax=Oryza meyeriana var. granulata TaxID=110450 RepID=A0A6G1CMP1_9ORYZ|nr:hypothetical protein E2562_000290 [Oryza meyeriana var. granulata]
MLDGMPSRAARLDAPRTEPLLPATSPSMPCARPHALRRANPAGYHFVAITAHAARPVASKPRRIRESRRSPTCARRAPALASVTSAAAAATCTAPVRSRRPGFCAKPPTRHRPVVTSQPPPHAKTPERLPDRSLPQPPFGPADRRMRSGRGALRTAGRSALRRP